MYENQMRLHEAIIFAENAHRGQKRKGTDRDYICHPMEVLTLVMKSSPRNADLQIAAVLHDTVEDGDVTLADIRCKFGDAAADYVAFMSEDKTKPWKERKETMIRSLKEASADRMILACADTLANLRSLAADHAVCGEELWTRFNGSKEEIRRYYREKLRAMRNLEIHALTRDLFGEACFRFETLFHEKIHPSHWC